MTCPLSEKPSFSSADVLSTGSILVSVISRLKLLRSLATRIPKFIVEDGNTNIQFPGKNIRFSYPNPTKVPEVLVQFRTAMSVLA